MPKLCRFVASLSLQLRMMTGLAMTWVVVVTILLAWGWYTGKDLVREVNFSHLRYETHLIADEVTEEIETRLAMLERVASRHSSGALLDPGGGVLKDNSVLLELFDGLARRNAQTAFQQMEWE